MRVYVGALNDIRRGARPPFLEVKIWKMKMELGLLEDSNIDWTAIEDNVGLSENKATSQFIANRAITLIKNDKNLVPLKPSKLKKIMHLILTTD